MQCPNKMLKIFHKEIKRNREDFKPLTPRKGRAVDKTFNSDLVDEEKAEILLTAWYSFHKRANHQAYKDFYSKLFYCLDLGERNIKEKTFLELIADREFLFHEYNESYGNNEYPPLSHLVRSHGVAKDYPPENVQKVLNQLFLPTNANSNDYQQWQKNLTELTYAKKQRMRQMQEMTVPLERIEIEIDSSKEVRLSPFEENLSRLFVAYLETREETGNATVSTKITWGKALWRAAIHCISDYLEKNFNNCCINKKRSGIKQICPLQKQSPAICCSYKLKNNRGELEKCGRFDTTTIICSYSRSYAPLVIYHLYTQNTEKLSRGELLHYEFKISDPPKHRFRDPMAFSSQTEVNTRINIQLYDQILELFLQKDLPKGDEKQKERYRADAKFLFYRYTRFDRYWHYDLTYFFRGGKPNIGFDYNENYRDGVDHFGNLLRFHINYCIPNQVQWLTPALSNDAGRPPASILATFLLAEASFKVQAKNRLVNRVQKLTKEQMGQLVEQYQKYYFDEQAKRRYLTQCCEEHNFHIPHEDKLIFEDNLHRPVSQYCGRYILEYFLRDYMIQQARLMLAETAKNLFDNPRNPNALFFEKFSYGKLGN